MEAVRVVFPMPAFRLLLMLAAILALGRPGVGAAWLDRQEARDDGPTQLRDLLPAQRLGARVRTVERAVGVSPVVVIVRDEPSFVEAIARWTPAVRYPVLFDDGSPEAREAIARFVHAFAPQQVISWEAPRQPEAWNARARRDAIEAALQRSWALPVDEAVPAMPALIARWRQLGAPPPGVVVAGEGESAWPAALALAAARMQPIVWLSAPGGINQTISDTDADAFCEALERSLDALGLRWNGLGDEIDAVTLCMNAPARLDSEAHGLVAFTARVGRLGSADRRAPRWAWSGHIFGSTAKTAADAMASIFLDTQGVWLFDSYPSDPPWSTYALASAAEIYTQMGLEVENNTEREQGLDDFLARSHDAIDAGFIAVNTKGRMAEFHLAPGTAAGRDVPFLQRPAAVYFIHSFSAQRPGVNTSVAGSWLSRGVFAYMGSVAEPGLQSFVPQATYAARLGSLFPFGAAGREDGLLENRKLALLGDPLWMLDTQPRTRVRTLPPLEDARPIDDRARAAIERGELGTAARLLRLAGRGDTLVDLAIATLRDEPGKVSASLADASLHALFEAGERRAFAAMFARLPASRQSDVEVEDLAWHALRPLLGEPDAAATMARLLSPHIRPQKLVEDSRALARALEFAGMANEARSLLRASLNNAQNDKDRSALEATLVSIGS